MTPIPEKIADQSQWDALRHQASRYTYCLIDETKQQAIGTAIAVNLRERFFFATAKHLIDNDHELKVLAVHPQAPAGSSDFIAKSFHDQLDVGLLELHSKAANRFDFTEDTRLLDEIDTEEELPTLVIGYPGQFIQSAEYRITDNVELLINRCDALVLRSVVLPQSEWPDNSSLYEPLTRDRDILVDYKPELRVKRLPPKTSTMDVQWIDCPELDPHGMSGGGIWLAMVEERNEGLRLSDARLIGIQTGWYRERGLLKGLRIGVWLNMVRTTLDL